MHSTTHKTMNKNLFYYFHEKLQCPKRRSSETPPTPATPCTPLTPQTPESSSSTTSSSQSSNGHDTPATPATPLPDSDSLPASSSSSSMSLVSTSLSSFIVSDCNATPALSSSSCHDSLGNKSSAFHQHEDGNKKKNKKRKTTHQQQLYLDFGQASFGSRSICPICNSLIVHGLLEDERQHEQICKEFQFGVPVTMALMKTMRTVSSVNSGQFSNKTCKGCIVEIRPEDCLAWRRKVVQVKRIVDQELGFVAPSCSSFRTPLKGVKPKQKQEYYKKRLEGRYKDDAASLLGNKTIYLYILEKRVVGFCSVEVISQAFQLYLHPRKLVEKSWKETDTDITIQEDTISHNSKEGTITRSTKPTKAIMGVHQLWCHKLHRNAGVASQLLDAARSKFIFGMTVPPKCVAFSSPTWDGARFAHRYSHPHAPLVYEL